MREITERNKSSDATAQSRPPEQKRQLADMADPSSRDAHREMTQSRDSKSDPVSSEKEGANNYSFIGAPEKLPNVQLTDNRAQFEKALLDPKSSVEQKLQMAESLANSGVTSMKIALPNGEEANVRLESEKLANGRSMVHVFQQQDNGKESVLLRGIDNGDGNFVKEKNRHGREVDFGALSRCLAGPEFPTRVPESDQSPERPKLPPIEDPRTSAASGATQEQLNAMFDNAASQSRGLGARGGGQGPVYFRAKMDVDADGSPRARQIDPCGQRDTSLHDEHGRPINAEKVPYIVLPGGHYKHLGIQLGDVAAVRYHGKVVMATFADVGPHHKLGEGSMALARALGMSDSPTHGGTQRREVEYMVFPGSRHSDIAKSIRSEQV